MASTSESSTAGRLWVAFGPGILWAATAIGVSHLVQSTRAGASAGFGLAGVILIALDPQVSVLRVRPAVRGGHRAEPRRGVRSHWTVGAVAVPGHHGPDGRRHPGHGGHVHRPTWWGSRWGSTGRWRCWRGRSWRRAARCFGGGGSAGSTCPSSSSCCCSRCPRCWPPPSACRGPTSRRWRCGRATWWDRGCRSCSCWRWRGGCPRPSTSRCGARCGRSPRTRRRGSGARWRRRGRTS